MISNSNNQITPYWMNPIPGPCSTIENSGTLSQIEPLDQKGRRIEWVTKSMEIIKEKSLSQILTEGEPVTSFGKAVFGAIDWINKCGQATLNATYSCEWLKKRKPRPDDRKIELIRGESFDDKRCSLVQPSFDYFELLAQDACLENSEIESAHLQVNFKTETGKFCNEEWFFLQAGKYHSKSDADEGAYSLNLTEAPFTESLDVEYCHQVSELDRKEYEDLVRGFSKIVENRYLEKMNKEFFSLMEPIEVDIQDNLNFKKLGYTHIPDTFETEINIFEKAIRNLKKFFNL